MVMLAFGQSLSTYFPWYSWAYINTSNYSLVPGGSFYPFFSQLFTTPFFKSEKPGLFAQAFRSLTKGIITEVYILGQGMRRQTQLSSSSWVSQSPCVLTPRVLKLGSSGHAVKCGRHIRELWNVRVLINSRTVAAHRACAGLSLSPRPTGESSSHPWPRGCPWVIAAHRWKTCFFFFLQCSPTGHTGHT